MNQVPPQWPASSPPRQESSSEFINPNVWRSFPRPRRGWSTKQLNQLLKQPGLEPHVTLLLLSHSIPRITAAIPPTQLLVAWSGAALFGEETCESIFRFFPNHTKGHDGTCRYVAILKQCCHMVSIGTDSQGTILSAAPGQQHQEHFLPFNMIPNTGVWTKNRIDP